MKEVPVYSKFKDAVYEKYRERGWEFDHNTDDGDIVMKKNTSSIPDFFSWDWMQITTKDKKLLPGFTCKFCLKQKPSHEKSSAKYTDGPSCQSCEGEIEKQQVEYRRIQNFRRGERP